METNKNQIKVALVDDDRRTLENLHDLLSFSPKVEVVLVATSGKSFLDKFKEQREDKIPAIVLMDVDMPDLNGIETVLIGKSKYPKLKFLMLTVYDDEEKLFQAIKAGASGYLLKDEKVSTIIKHMESLNKDLSAPMSPKIAQKTLELLAKSEIKGETMAPDFALSKREKEVLRLMVDGKNYKEIGIELFISKNTVKKHLVNIYEKLHVTSKAKAIQLVYRYNIV